MSTQIDIHPVQSSILCRLLFTKEGRFKDLNTLNLSTDHFSFHIKQLTDWGLVKKLEKGKYTLTPKGKEFANRFDTDKNEVERQAKVAVLLVAVKTIKGKKKYLIQQRLKQPYFGFWGFVTGKIAWGEITKEAASRELNEETGLKGNIKLVGVKHKIDYTQDQKLLEDKYFFVFKVTNLKGKLKEKFEGGRNKWLTEEEILKLKNLFDGAEESMNFIKKPIFKFSEIKYLVKKY